MKHLFILCALALAMPSTHEFVLPEKHTLRDSFAMAALTGMLIHPNSPDVSDVGRLAYSYADAMLKAREQK